MAENSSVTALMGNTLPKQTDPPPGGTLQKEFKNQGKSTRSPYQTVIQEPVTFHLLTPFVYAPGVAPPLRRYYPET